VSRPPPLRSSTEATARHAETLPSSRRREGGSTRTIYLVRHAATEFEGKWIGTTDVPLSSAGRRQADELARTLSRVGADTLFASDLLRAQETAIAIGGLVGLTPKLMPGLRECDFGAWEGLTWEQIAVRFPSDAEAYLNDWLTIVPPGGERLEAMRERVLAAWGEIVRADWTRGILVGHGGSNRLLLAEFLGMPLSNLFRIGQDIAAVNLITFVDGVPCVDELNRRFDST
jgi:broad specificity phosphatase PhoE